MIKASELRMGNWVKYFGTTTVSRIDVYSFVGMEEGLQDYDPIELTPEILEKCGGLEHCGLVDLNDHEFGNPEYYLDNGEGLHLGQEIKYLHQLQNLYFALTGEELQIAL